MEIRISYKEWNINNLIGYEPKTTAYMDLGIAENYGYQAVVNTYHRLFKEFKKDYKLITELTMALNWKIYEHFERKVDLSALYDKLFKECRDWCQNNLKGKELEYYYRTTD